MPKISFTKPQTPASDAPNAGGVAFAEAPETESGNTESAVAFAVGEGPVGPCPDEIPLNDVVLPRLNIAQRVGELGDTFPPGSLVFDSTLELPKPVRIMVLGFAPTIFVEKVEGGARGGVCHTEAEVVKVGGTLDWNEAQATDRPLYQRCAKALLFLEKPEGLDSLAFPYENGGKSYAFVTWNLKATGYTKGAKVIFTARKIGMLRDDSKGGYRGGIWTLDTATEKFQNNTYYVPKLKLVEATTPEFRAYAKSIVGF